MRFRLTLGLGMAIGYVLGARAGRPRYDQIVALARRTKANPAVHDAAVVLGQQASSAAHSLQHALHRDKISDEMPYAQDIYATRSAP